MSVEVVAAALGIPALLAGAVAVAVRGERRARRLANRLLGDDQVPGALDRLDEVYRQLHPNSGSSLRDRVDQTHELLTTHLAAPLDQAHRP